MKTKKLIYIGVLVAQALVLYIFESMIPMPFITPGAKYGMKTMDMSLVELYKSKIWQRPDFTS